MTTTGIATFDKTIRKTNEWVRDVMNELRVSDTETAYVALHATLQALRDRLTIEEAAQLSAQLPMLIRGLYFEGWDPAGKPRKERRKEEFLARVRAMFPTRRDLDPERVARAVFAVLAKRVSAGEIADVLSILPHELKDLWPVEALARSR